jgi:predicted acyl esterase
LQPPHLAAICAWEGAADFYRDATHHGGILSTFFRHWYDKQVGCRPEAVTGPDPAAGRWFATINGGTGEVVLVPT